MDQVLAPDTSSDTPEAESTAEGVADRSAEEARNIETFERFTLDVWQRGHDPTIDELVSPQCLFHLPVGDLQGRDAFRQHVLTSKAAFSDFELEFEDVVSEGDRVVARWMLSMTHSGELQGAEATGRRVSLEGITIARLYEGQIFEAWDCWNMLDLLGQIDALPTFEDDEDDED